MTYISIITRHPEDIPAYLGFGAEIIETGVNKFGDSCIICTVPKEHAQWNAIRLGSGMHGARVHEDEVDLDAWKQEWGYKATEQATSG